MRRDTRSVWVWCLAYTVVAPGAERLRRRAEIRNHLWESEHAGLAAGTIVSAALRGAADDLAWAGGAALRALARLCVTPMFYVVLAAAFPLQAWAVAAAEPNSTAHPYEAAGALGGAGMLLVAATLSWALRRRRD